MNAKHDEIARRAYELWQKGGRQPGRDQEYWFQAEAELMTAQPKSAKPMAADPPPKASFANAIPITPHLESTLGQSENRKQRAQAR